MRTKNIWIVKFGVAFILIPIFTGLIYTSDRLLLHLLRRNSQIAYSTVQGFFGKNSAKITKNNIGTFIKEGSLLSNAGQRFAHHDSLSDYTVSGNGNKNIWIFGDSWGTGIKTNNIKNNIIATKLDGNFKNIRFIAESSWSPLLFRIAYNHRLNIYEETPDIVVFFIDQTDLGDDYCRYRPYVLRDKFGNLTGVVRSEFNEIGGSKRWSIHLAFAEHSSGIKLTLQRLIHSLYYSFVPGIIGLNDCSYDELMAWQVGKNYSPSGAPVENYLRYFKKTLSELAKNISENDKRTKVLYVTHDWAQHSLPLNHKDRFDNNIKTIVLNHSEVNSRNSVHLHVSTAEYDNVDLKQIYQYPSDRFSHLLDYSLLSKKISFALKKHLKIDTR